MTHLTQPSGPIRPMMDEDDEESGSKMRAPVVDAKSDRLNPEVEYDVLDLMDERPDDLKKKLNDLGKEGWQLVATSPSFIFRRLKKHDDEKKRTPLGFGTR